MSSYKIARPGGFVKKICGFLPLRLLEKALRGGYIIPQNRSMPYIPKEKIK